MQISKEFAVRLSAGSFRSSWGCCDVVGGLVPQVMEDAVPRLVGVVLLHVG